MRIDGSPAAVTASDESQAGGPLSLQITQIAPASGSSAGGSGLISFGTYLLQLVDVHGKRVPHGLRAPLTLKYHYDAAESGLNLGHAFIVLNGPLPRTVKLAPAAAANFAVLGARTTQNATLDATQRTLTVTPLVGSPSSSISWNTDSPVASFGKPDIFNADLSAGSLSASYPIDVPAGPGGFTPPVSLAYSSAGVSENHGVQSAAGWVGEGWTLAPGSISWAEHNVLVGVSGTLWQNSWQFSDPFGTSAELIPPTITTSISLDDTGQSISSSVSWQTVPDAHIKIISYPGPNSLPGAPANPPCFRVFLQNGVMEEFGCTLDSLQYYYGLSGTHQGGAYVSSWLLDMVVDSKGNQIHYTYQADTATDSGGHTYPRDVVLSNIEWDSPNCLDTQNRCTGTNWTPLLRLNFWAVHIPTRSNSPSGCNNGSNLRCDDPVDLSGSGGLAAPQVESTLVLNDLYVQVNTSGTWNNLKHYQFSYEQSGPGSILDPQTSKQESTAGMLDLTQISVVGDDNTTQEPVRSFSYSSQTEHYEDDAYFAPQGNCGPSWNTGCLMWSQSYAGNSRYLASVTNGMGLSQTFSWAEARNNTHGVYGGGSNDLDPLYCDDPSRLALLHCNQADDQNWSHIVLTEEDDSVVQLSQSGQGGQPTSKTITSKTVYTYQLTGYTANPCSDCLQGMYWGNQNDADYLDYYNGKFMGFAQTTVSNPDGSVDVHQYRTTLGWGLYDAPNTAPNYIPCPGPNPCHADPWWNPGNALHGHEYETDQYDTNGTTLLHQTKTQYSVQCPPSGVSGSGSTSYGNFDGNLVSELDHNNPVAACDIQTSQVDDYTDDGSSASGVPDQTTTYVYDSYGRVTTKTVTVNDGSATGSPTTLVYKTAYEWNDAVNPSTGQGVYLIDFPTFTDVQDTAGNRYSCTGKGYDGQSATGQNSGLTKGELTNVDQQTFCGTSPNFTDQSGLVRTTYTYDSFGNQASSKDADASVGISGHTTTCFGTGPSASTCTQYDTTFDALSVATENALGQQEQTGYTQNITGGYGLWQTSTTDVNGQTTTYGYDGLGRMTSRTLPGETSGQPTTTWAYTFWCAQSGPQAPCMEVDETQRLNAATTITTRAFYDGLGRLVELRSPGPSGQDVVHFRFYDPSGRVWFESIQYFVAAYTGGPGAAAYSIPDTMQAGTSTTFDGMGRVLTTKDAVSNQTTNIYSVVCGTISGDSACYEQGLVQDPLGHQRATLGDALGRESYDVRYTGNSSSTYHVYATTKFTYDYNTNLTKILAPDGVTTTTFQFDMVGRQTGLVDPDRGTESYVYDPNGNRTQSTDARGISGTFYVGYDGLNRQLWRSTSSNGSNPYVTYTYDSTANGNYGVGHVTNETFTNGTLPGSYSYVYDQRGQEIKNTLTVGSINYPIQAGYDDAGNILTQTYPDGEVVTNSYTTQGWLSGVNTQVGSTNVTLLGNASYTGAGGAGHLITGATLDGGMYQYATTYDALGRLTDTRYALSSNGATLYEEQRAFDGAGNVTNETTTFPQGTDAQAFCYDEQNRVTWAGSVGTPPCTGTAISTGTLTSAQYSQSYSYDTLGRLTSGSLGSYTYGDSAHVHAVTSIGGSYTAKYDVAGNMICRAPTSTNTCVGSSTTGATLTYDVEGRLSSWHSPSLAPTATDSFLYDGEGNRVAQSSTLISQTTTTVYVGNLEEVATTGSSTSTTTYYYAGGQRIALAVNGIFSYLAPDAETSISVAFDANGHVQASQLYSPYGAVRYSNGTMPGYNAPQKLSQEDKWSKLKE